MSDLRIALVAEGPTDASVINAALRSLLPRPFVLTQLQPESTLPKLGGGWGGVLRWCEAFSKRGFTQFEDDPTLPGFDLFVLHVDADVCESSYSDYGSETAAVALEQRWPPLPSVTPCPPPAPSTDVMRTCLLSWANIQAPGSKTVLCVPSKSVEAWLAAALLADNHALLANLECNLRLEVQLAGLPKAQRIKKGAMQYKAKERAVTDNWPTVRQRCTQAERFSLDVANAVI